MTSDARLFVATSWLNHWVWTGEQSSDSRPGLSRLFTLADQQRQSDDSYLAGNAALNDFECCRSRSKRISAALSLWTNQPSDRQSH